MPSYFDPIKHRKGLSEKMIKLFVEEDDSFYRPCAVGNAASSGIETVLSAWLVGLHEEIAPALRKYRTWFEDSLRRDEKFGESPEFSAKIRSESYGLCLWMLENADQKEQFRQAANHEEKSWASNWNGGGPASPEDIRENIGDYFANCIQSGEFERAISMYESVSGKPVTDPGKVVSISDLGYWICYQALRGDPTSPQKSDIGKRVLGRYLESDWLTHGQFKRAAVWLRILFWHPGDGPTPLKTVLTAYELMPHVSRPSFL